MEVGEGAVEFDVGVAVGAAVGALGCPMGVAVGVAVGWAAGELFGAGFKWFDDSGTKDDAVDAIGDANRAVGDFFGVWVLL